MRVRISEHPGIEPKAIKAVLPALRRLRADIERTTKEWCPEVTGNLKSTISVSLNEATGVITSRATADYAAAIEYGTEKYDIYPKVKKALYWNGAEHPVKVVHHDATAPQPFIRTGIYLNRGNRR